MFFSRKEYLSLKNGAIIVHTSLFSVPSILVKGCMQSGSYIISMWRNAFKVLPEPFLPKSILILGLGGGDTIKLLSKKYKDARVTVIEWDETMIGIAQELNTLVSSERVRILQGDAFEIVPTLRETFDLIIVDLFTGDTPPYKLTENATLASYRTILNKDGYLLVNFYRHTTYIPSFENFFFVQKVWEFKLNTLALFRCV